MCNARSVTTGAMDGKNIFDLPLDQYASTYSTGMKKKLAILAILVQENSVFVLDEPFNGVDIQSNMLITGIIHKLKALGKTVIISSHIFSTLSETCDEIQLLREGRFIRKVSHADYKDLEEAMKAVTIGDRIEKLNLR
jgi:ABC-2 type transport system ATP-binding protein